MSSTNDYQKRIALARRREVLSEGRRSHQITENTTCPECDCDPCECEEENDNLMGRMPRESLEVMEILAATDPHTFAFMVECEGLRVAAIREQDPLQKETMSEDIDALASVISEDIMEIDEGLDQYQVDLKDLAADYGYCIMSR